MYISSLHIFLIGMFLFSYIRNFGVIVSCDSERTRDTIKHILDNDSLQMFLLDKNSAIVNKYRELKILIQVYNRKSVSSYNLPCLLNDQELEKIIQQLEASQDYKLAIKQMILDFANIKILWTGNCLFFYRTSFWRDLYYNIRFSRWLRLLIDGDPNKKTLSLESSYVSKDLYTIYNDGTYTKNS